MDMGEFFPGYSHGDRGAGKGAQAVNGGNGLARQVLEVIDIDFSTPGGDGTLGGGQFRKDLDNRGPQLLDKGGRLLEGLDRGERQVKVDAGGSGELGKDLQPQAVSKLFYGQGHLFCLFQRGRGHGVQVENDVTGVIRVPPGGQLGGGPRCNPG